MLTLFGAAVWAAQGLAAPVENVLAQGRSGVVVLDLSRSIGPRPMADMHDALERLASPDQRLGVVAFSDTAYELLPPGSPGTELRPILRFFTPVPGRRTDSGAPVFPADPWSDSFRGGTQISIGLRVGLRSLRRAHVGDGALLLVSDLADEEDDLESLAQVAQSLRAARVPLRILALHPHAADRKLFERLFGGGAFVGRADSLTAGGLTRRVEVALHAPLPWALVGAALALLAALGVNELLCGRLAWRTA